MNDAALLVFVETNAQRVEFDTLKAAAEFLNDLVALKRSGKPPGLKVGVAIDASRIAKLREGSTIEIYRGAYVHAMRPDWGPNGFHFYGVAVDFTPQSVYLEDPYNPFGHRIRYTKCEVFELLSESEWAQVDAVLAKGPVEPEGSEIAFR